jgi:phage terminase small subunit
MARSNAPLPALTPKQQRFVEEYLLDMNATQAAIRAGYSRKTANEQGAQLLAKPGVMAAVNAAKINRADKLEVDAEFVLQRLVEEANADLADLYTAAGDLKPVDEWPEVWRRGLVAGVEIEALYEGTGKHRTHIGYAKKIRLSDRVRRLELIGKHIGVQAFKVQVEVGGFDGLADRLERLKHIQDLEQKEQDAKVRDLEDRLSSALSGADAKAPEYPAPAPGIGRCDGDRQRATGRQPP